MSSYKARPRTGVKRRGVLLMLACAFAGTSCRQIIQFYSDCGETETGDGENVPPCLEAGVEDAGLDGPDGDAPDA